MTEDEKDIVMEGRKIQIHYTVEEEGRVADTTEGKPPLYYIHGGASLLPAIQRRLAGRREGETVEFTLPPEEAYGAFDPAALIEVPMSEMPKRELKVGMMLQEETGGGQVKVGRIAEIREHSVVMNFNHPMAGKTLHYKVRIHSVNDC